MTSNFAKRKTKSAHVNIQQFNCFDELLRGNLRCVTGEKILAEAAKQKQIKLKGKKNSENTCKSKRINIQKRKK
jgi:hypothetical protein